MHQRYAADFAAFWGESRKLPADRHESAGAAAGPQDLASDCDVCTDLRSYDVLRDGEHVATTSAVTDLFDADMVTFYIGSSVSFDGLLDERGWHPGWGPCVISRRKTACRWGRFAGKLPLPCAVFPQTSRPRWRTLPAAFPLSRRPIAIDGRHP